MTVGDLGELDQDVWEALNLVYNHAGRADWLQQYHRDPFDGRSPRIIRRDRMVMELFAAAYFAMKCRTPSEES